MSHLKPRMSEKAYQQSLLKQTYVFEVPKDMNKIQIKDAIQAQFKVDVLEVNTVVQSGKTARSIRLGNRRARPILGQRSDVKKAYVKIKDGQSIKIFEEEKKEEKSK